MARLALLAACILPAHAQTITSSVTGAVSDSTGRSVPDAGVTLKNAATGVTTTTRTDTAGSFTFSGVQPGAYSISVTSTGFRPLEVTGIELASGLRRAD